MNAFYYIDYCMAQTMAFQFWMTSLSNREEAWKKYLAFVDLGGTKTFEELAHGAGMKVPYDPGCIKFFSSSSQIWLRSSGVSSGRSYIICWNSSTMQP